MNPNSDNTRHKQRLIQLAQAGKLTEARKLGDQLCRQDPTDAEAWFLLGAVQGQLGDFRAAEHCCRQALPLAPEHPALNYNLAIALLRQNRADEAMPHLEKTLALQPRHADAWRDLGNARAACGDKPAAITCYLKASELDPLSARTHFCLGNLYRDLQRWDEAIDSYQQAIRLQPDFEAACIELSSILIQRFKFGRAIEMLEDATKSIPHSAELEFKLAVACFDQGDSDTALEHYRRALKLNPSHINARIGVAGALGLQGKYQEAAEELETIFQLSPGNPTAITTYAQFAPRLGTTDRAIWMIEQRLEENDLSDRLRASLHFSLGKLHDRRDDYDTAFRHFDTGNRLVGAHFDYTSWVQMFDALMSAYAPGQMNTLPRSENTSDIPVFVVGVPRSGTSLVEQILSSHPLASGAGELPHINYIVDNLPRTLRPATAYPHCLNQFSTPFLTGQADKYLDVLLSRGGENPRVIDKSPLNFIHLGLIELLFPHARIIHCTRDPVDTCLSCFFQNFSGEHPYAYSLTDLGRFYRLYQRLMTHWKRVIQLPILEVKYEDMVLEQESETRRLLEFCGLDWDPACLDFHTTRRTVATASHEQVRQPMYTRSIGRWRKFEKHLAPLLESLKLRH